MWRDYQSFYSLCHSWAPHLISYCHKSVFKSPVNSNVKRQGLRIFLFFLFFIFKQNSLPVFGPNLGNFFQVKLYAPDCSFIPQLNSVNRTVKLACAFVLELLV